MNKSRKNRNQKVIIKIWLKERDKQFWGKVLGFKIQKKKKKELEYEEREDHWKIMNKNNNKKSEK